MPDRMAVIDKLNDMADYLRNKSYSDLLARDFYDTVGYAIALLKEQDDHIRNLTSDLEDLQKEHQRLLDKKIPLITQGQEVVRCKDCKWYKNYYCTNWTCTIGREPNWFCADGERK